MEMRLAPDSVAYGTLMDAYAKAGQPDKAMDVAEQMKARQRLSTAVASTHELC